MQDIFNKILNQAVEAEILSRKLYEQLSNMAKNAESKILLDELAQEESKHEHLLKEIDIDRIHQMELTPVQDPDIVRAPVSFKLNDNATFQDIMLFAINREEYSKKFYSQMARILTSADIKKLFDFLAAEETKHKVKLEEKYSEIFYTGD